ncbi:DUF4429 domain-containing protein [Streptomyces thermolineatus]|uniref:DUF4429 domain-containing protein n=1 Tax=Streptomyces thermolineatus TaxID=44033 RepID=UPI00384AC3B6
MGEVLTGVHATWEFGTDAVHIRYERGVRTPRLLQVLGERRLPYEAVASVETGRGRRGTVVLRARPRPGTDPLTDAADGQLRDSADPYRLVLPADREGLAEHCARLVREAASGSGRGRNGGFLLPAPPVPLQFGGRDGRASFDGREVFFHWSLTGASAAKWKAGDQTFPVERLAGVEWRPPRGTGGHLRLLLREGGQPADPAEDPAAVVLGLVHGAVHDSLPFAAAVLAASRAAGGAAPAPSAYSAYSAHAAHAALSSHPAASAARAGGPGLPAAAGSARYRSDAADIADRIRHLGELRGAGLLTDEEFTTKKAQLLAEL